MTNIDLTGTRFDGADRRERPDRPAHVYPPDAPWPSGERFGFTEKNPVTQEELVWECRFLCTPAGIWFCTFQDGVGADTSLFGQGDTPRESFDSLIERFKMVNGGSLTRGLRDHLPALYADLDSYGLV